MLKEAMDQNEIMRDEFEENMRLLKVEWQKKCEAVRVEAESEKVWIFQK